MIWGRHQTVSRNSIFGKALIKQTVSETGKDYFKEICNSGTDNIIIYIHQVLNNLVTAYGMVDLNVLDIEEDKAKSLFWDLSDTPVKIYNAIEDLVEVSELANISNYPTQVIHFGLNIIRKSSDFD